MTAPGNIIIGISGGIAAYKIPLLIRMFRKNNFGVKVVCTKNALEFVTPLTLETLSQNTVYSDVFSETEEYSTAHISITDNADAMIVAPATANIIAKFANGIADDALSTTFLSFNKQVFIAPAMNTKMLTNPATQKNIEILKQRGVIFIEPDSGFLACGYEGKGRMSEPQELFDTVVEFFKTMPDLSGINVLVTAGPTHEAIDPVRFIGNRSSGKMGYAIADAFAKAGASVTLISGPSSVKSHHPHVNLIKINSAEEMFAQCVSFFPDNQITIMAAAVADFTPSVTAVQKIKKNDQLLSIELKPTKDILKHLGSMKNKNQILVGFALETHNEEANAKEKLRNKNLDCIVLNSLQDKGSGFEFDTNKIKIITAETSIEFELKHKNEVASDILHFIYNNLIKK
jgi:phosphopantothenoylcysteine decarboxylase / phosphopantothenate---cysteine ligase